jgi:hypothetical protein
MVEIAVKWVVHDDSNHTSGSTVITSCLYICPENAVACRAVSATILRREGCMPGRMERVKWLQLHKLNFKISACGYAPNRALGILDAEKASKGQVATKRNKSNKVRPKIKAGICEDLPKGIASTRQQSPLPILQPFQFVLLLGAKSHFAVPPSG